MRKRKMWALLGVLCMVLQVTLPVLAEESAYAGSETCVNCHSDVHDQVSGSVHGSFAKDAAQDPSIVPGDFSGGWSKVLGFKKEDVRFVLLSKPGHLVTTELVGQKGTYGAPADDYPVLWASWENPAKEWVIEGAGAGAGSPYLNTCAGCHVTGLKVPTKDNPKVESSFAELGLTCENCHGPAKAHSEDPMEVKPVASTAAEVCGQCHERGASVGLKPNGKTFGYPMSADGKQYQLGDDLSKYYKTSNPKDNPNDWWPNGLAKNSHHMQYPEWLASPHANTMKVLTASGHAGDSCLKCHSTDAIVNEDAKMADAKVAVTCQACHDSHDPSKLRVDEKELCASCHNAEGSVKPGSAVHHPTKEMVEGAGVPGAPLTPSVHMQAGVTCQDCHMPKVAGNEHKGSHLMKVVTPAEGIKYNMPDSCTACHNASKEYMQSRLDQIQNSTDTKLKALNAKLAALQAGNEKNPTYLEAKLNVDFVTADKSRGFHNPAYTSILLEQAEQKLNSIK